ncbi:THAP domain-containing protein 11-like [Haemaphysalis longicornis]
MVGFTCCVPGCYNNSVKHKGIRFHVFPKDPKLREEWVQMINRVGQSGKFSKFVPTTGHKVCGEHFEVGRKPYMVRVPTIFTLKQKKIVKRHRRYERRVGVSESTVSRIWITWLDFLNNRLIQVPTSMPPQLGDKYHSQAFLTKGYSHCRWITGLYGDLHRNTIVISCPK